MICNDSENDAESSIEEGIPTDSTDHRNRHRSNPEPNTTEVCVISDDSDDSDGSLFGHEGLNAVSPTQLMSDAQKQDKRLPGADTPKAMSCNLMPHQRLGLEWLLEHELGEDKGGILADDMGLGKTIQALALMLENPPKSDAKYKTTLIVAPLALLKQWPREINDKIRPDYKLKVHVFHGAGRKISTS